MHCHPKEPGLTQSSDAPTDSDRLHQLLAEATPEERTLHLLRLVEHEPRLNLPRRPGERLALLGLRLDPATLLGHVDGKDAKPHWWIAETGGIRLRQADCREANFQDADFTGADLGEADFSDATLRSAIFTDAVVEAANFERADMSNVSFAGTRASEARFADALLEDANFAGSVLRFSHFERALLDSVNFETCDAWGACFDEAEASYVNFRNACLQEASFAGADCNGADFEGADLRKTSFADAKLKSANLADTKLAGASFARADLTEASLTRLNLSSCDLTHARLDGAWLDSTRFEIDQLGGAVGEEVAGDYAAARRAYLGLERNFRTLGDPDAASWSYRRGRRMGKRAAQAACTAAMRARDWRGVFSSGVAAATDGFSEWLCDYGESMPRVLRAYVVVLLSFAAFYGLSGSLLHAGSGHASTSVADLLSFSFLNMSTSVSPDIGLKPRSELVYFIGSLQYVIGVVLIGLFGYVLGNRIRR